MSQGRAANWANQVDRSKLEAKRKTTSKLRGRDQEAQQEAALISEWQLLTRPLTPK